MTKLTEKLPFLSMFEGLPFVVNGVLKDLQSRKAFIKNNWHWHSLGLPLGFLVTIAGKSDHPWLSMFKRAVDGGTTLMLCLSFIFAIITSYGIEIAQGLIYGANKTADELIGSNKDIFFTFCVIMIGCIIGILNLK